MKSATFHIGGISKAHTPLFLGTASAVLFSWCRLSIAPLVAFRGVRSPCFVAVLLPFVRFALSFAPFRLVFGAVVYLVGGAVFVRFWAVSVRIFGVSVFGIALSVFPF